ncbi:MAG: serine/threonine-protein phosphatase [Lachnospiraceae bacterium]|nr:serine/threonine-protein phosphatase [Lachnospiraceae bacterium]
MKICICSKIGNGKSVCEDAAMVAGTIISDSYFEIQTEQTHTVAIADGVGGNAGGDCASRFVLEKMNEVSMADISVEYLKQFIVGVNEALLSYASSSSGRENMATTLTGLIMTSDSGYLFHVGNTRIYGLQGNYLKQLTEDQTTYQWLLNIGQMDAAEKCNKNEITHCLGGGSTQYGSAICVKEHDTLNAYKRLLLTTDGIHEYVSIDELEDFMSGEVSEITMQMLADKAKGKGSLDDQTIIVIDRM